jgi:hypothetical protein
MTRIAYLLLCHTDPHAVIEKARAFSRAGDRVAIHCDRRAGRRFARQVAEGVRGDPAIVLTRRRVRCGWGDWSLVRATLELMRTALRAFPDATHVYLVSGDCLPAKPAAHIRAALAQSGCDHIESVDFLHSGWIKTGFKAERLIYRHAFNERRNPRLFYACAALQARLGLARPLPSGLRIMIGSQWWCLRRDTADRILRLVRRRRDIVRFFALSWIPDETFFQTLVRLLVPASEIADRSPTFVLFSDYGLPVMFHDDHFDLLAGQPQFFARKISPDAAALRARLSRLYLEDTATLPQAPDGAALYRCLAGLGRDGDRCAPRIWDRQGTLGHDRELLLVAGPDRARTQRLLDAMSDQTGLPCLSGVFERSDAALPALGGGDWSLDKRNRHRRAFMRLLFDALATDRLILRVDPGDLDLIRDFAADRATTRILSVQPDRDLPAPREQADPVQTALSHKAARDMDRLQDAAPAPLHSIRLHAPPARNARAMAAFLSVGPRRARAILEDAGLPSGVSEEFERRA